MRYTRLSEATGLPGAYLLEALPQIRGLDQTRANQFFDDVDALVTDPDKDIRLRDILRLLSDRNADDL